MTSLGVFVVDLDFDGSEELDPFGGARATAVFVVVVVVVVLRDFVLAKAPTFTGAEGSKR